MLARWPRQPHPRSASPQCRAASPRPCCPGRPRPSSTTEAESQTPRSPTESPPALNQDLNSRSSVRQSVLLRGSPRQQVSALASRPAAGQGLARPRERFAGPALNWPGCVLATVVTPLAPVHTPTVPIQQTSKRSRRFAHSALTLRLPKENRRWLRLVPPRTHGLCSPGSPGSPPGFPRCPCPFSCRRCAPSSAAGTGASSGVWLGAGVQRLPSDEFCGQGPAPCCGLRPASMLSETPQISGPL